MNNPSIDERLALVAALVRPGARFADVGTDHAYLPLYLLSRGVITSAVASDIAKGPLASARENVVAAGREGDVTLLLADGLRGMEGLGLTDIAICGMGGEMIADILEAAPFVRDPSLRLILQPMSRAEVLRAYLAGNGFSVLSERYAMAGGRAYLCLLVSYTGRATVVDPLRAVLGDPALRDPADADAFCAYLDLCERKAISRARGKRIGSVDACAEEALVLAIKKEREALL